MLQEKPLKALPVKTLNSLVEAVAVVLSIVVIAQFIPESVFNELPATGGDTGSHFWPVKVLRDYGIPNLVMRPWNPGNNGGEGLLVHYFPLPFVFMALLGYLIPVGTAFNVGSILPVVTLPLCVWWSVRLMSHRMLPAVLAAFFSSAVVLNEGYTMWGGNTLSTLSGQFAHMYALNFLVLAFGVLWQEIEKKKVPWKSGLLLSCVALSHGYIFFGVPPLLLLATLLVPKHNVKSRFITCALSALFSLGLSAWFIGPMILNGPWVTAHTFSWVFQNWPEEVVPKIFEPIFVIALVSLLLVLYRGVRKRDYITLRVLLFWFLASLVYLAFFFVFRWLKLVDVRALPQTQLFLAMSIGCLSSLALKGIPPKARALVAILIVGFLFYWQSIHVIKFPIWANWNYSGWQSKPKYQDLEKLSDALRGDLSRPRVAYEHHLKNNHVGTERVFEMLPYFANRSTTESLYLQSTVLAPMIFSLTSEISQASSCPFHQWPCMRRNVIGSKDRQELLGVKELILSSDIVLSEAKKAPFLRETFRAGAWSLFENLNPVSMVDVFREVPDSIKYDHWRDQFWYWFRDYRHGNKFLITSKREQDLPAKEDFTSNPQCHPETKVDFSGIRLRTDCPNVAHYLKYAYHPSFTSSGGEPIFLVSPGFLGIVPKSNEVKLTFGSSWSWTLFRWLSFVTFVFIVFTGLRSQQTYRRLVFKPVQRTVKSKKKKVVAEKALSRWPFYSVLFLAVCGYGYISYSTDTPLFWKWRSLNFSDFEIVSHQQGYGVLQKNANLKGEPIVLKGAIRYSGIGTHANSNTRIRIKSNKRFLLGSCGYPDNARGARIKCEIREGGRVLFSSMPMGDDNREVMFMVPVRKNQELELIVVSLKDNINAAHAVWVDMRMTDSR
ncbi:MAG: hypothetical protein EBR01_11795 [Proteobacteria bacterium]|nr:hypothetical protein [Pseudomonadota bacterium]